MKPILTDEFKKKIQKFFDDNVQAYGIKITPTLIKKRFCPTKIMLKLEFVNQRDEVISLFSDIDVDENNSVTLNFDRIIQNNYIHYDE